MPFEDPTTEKQDVRVILGRLIEGYNRILTTLNTINERLDSLSAKIDVHNAEETTYRSQQSELHTDIAKKMTAMEMTQAEQAKDITGLRDDVNMMMKLIPFIKAEAYVLTALCIPAVLAVIVFVWQLVIHQVQIVPIK